MRRSVQAPKARAPLLLLLALLACTTPSGPGIIDKPEDPPVPMAELDDLLNEFMTVHGIRAAAVGVMRGGSIVYEKGFGFLDDAETASLPDDAMMRLASVSKPITAAAIRRLISDGALGLDDRVFEVGQPEPGILDLAPFPSLGDARLGDVTVEHLLLHEGGWDRDIAGDLTYREVLVSEEMGVASPPGRERTVRWILGHPLEHAPGSTYAYSNIGFLVLGLIVEHVSGRGYLEYVRDEIFAPLGVDPTDLIQGRTFPPDRNSREPWYDDDRMVQSVFDPTGPLVRLPDGGWDHEARIAQGGLVSATRPLLAYLDAYYVSGPNIGAPRSGSEGSTWRRNHTGSLPGTNTLARQRGDGINYVVLLNRRPSSGTSYSSLLRTEIDALFDSGEVTWPN